MAFGQLKNELGIESSGNLDHHLKKLENLVIIGSDGLYKLSDEGKEALMAVKIIETNITIRKTKSFPQPLWLIGIVGTFFAVFLSAIVIATIPLGATINQIGLIGAIVGTIIGFLGAMLGFGGSVIADSRSSQPLTYFPSKNSPWQAKDWVAHLLFIGSYLTLLFSLVYAQLFSPNYDYKPIWFSLSLVALNMLWITSIIISDRVLVKANRIIKQVS